MTKVSTIYRNIIHYLTIEINNMIMGITSTYSNTPDPKPTLITYGTTPTRVTMVSPDDNDFMPPSFPEREQVVHI